jgi:hypothetical protein
MAVLHTQVAAGGPPAYAGATAALGGTPVTGLTAPVQIDRCSLDWLLQTAMNPTDWLKSGDMPARLRLLTREALTAPTPDGVTSSPVVE